MILQISDDENIKVKIANNFFKKLIGFMGKKDFDYGIIFPKTNSIHTFFMKENIDVIGFDNHGIIIFKAVNVEKNKVIKKYVVMYEPTDVVRKAYIDMQKKKSVSVYGFIANVQRVLCKLLPHNFVMSIWCKQQKLK